MISYPLYSSAASDVYKRQGFQSGRDTDKFADAKTTPRAINGVYYVPYCTKAFLSGKVVQTVEFETHVLFIADVTEARELSSVPAMTYSYYFENVKPKPAALAEQKGWVLSLIHISEPTRQAEISYAVFCLKKKNNETTRKAENSYGVFFLNKKKYESRTEDKRTD